MTLQDEDKLDVIHHFAGGVYAKEMTLKTMNDGMININIILIT